MAVVMVSTTNSLPLWFLVLFLLQTNAFLIASQPQNIETFYPDPHLIHPTPSPVTLSPPPPPDQPSPRPSPLPLPSSSSSTTIVKAVAATAAGSAALAGLFIVLFQRRMKARREKAQRSSQLGRFSSLRRSDFSRIDGVVRGLIVDENGLDVLYWRKLKAQDGWSSPNSSNARAGNGRSDSFRRALDLSRSPRTRNASHKPERAVSSSSRTPRYGELRKEVPEETKQEVALLRGHTSSSADAVEHRDDPSPPRRPRLPQKLPPPVSTSSAIQTQTALVEPPPLPLPPAMRWTNQKEQPVPPPLPSKTGGLTKPPPVKAVELAKPPPPPPPQFKAGESTKSPPPPPPKVGGLTKPPPPPPPPKVGGLTKPPPPPPVLQGKAAKRDGRVGQSSTLEGPKMKPLHWDKVEVNGDHSMVWDKIEGGSFR